MTASADRFIAEARATYIAANAATLRWMLARPALKGAFLDTKVNSLTLADYGPADGSRGPDFTYGWIQGRGLEALVTHARFFTGRDDQLAAALDARARTLFERLEAMQRQSGHAYFCYDASLEPVWFDAHGQAHRQTKSPDIFTYSDAFVAKGLVAAAARYAPERLPSHLDYLAQVIAAIEDGRFRMDEKRPLSRTASAAQPADFGPRMILLGSAGLLKRIGQPQKAGFADRFIDHVLAHHHDPKTGLLVNVPGEDACNVGHAIEFVGFALEWLGREAQADRLALLERILLASFRYGFIRPGITASVSMASGEPLSPYCPWWSLPETIRAAALCHALTGSDDTLAVWRTAHEAFFRLYWRETPPIAYQTLTRSGPVDHVPATPDLDPAYHTSLSLLAAIEGGVHP
jgi:mannose/cellobiose epimerase-like protein (N-acyl-D-glucosamine 2-epimerase family)